MTQNTHVSIDPTLVGTVTKIEPNFAEVLLHTTQRMAADAQGLVHGGFVFGAADYAAMCAVNDPYVVLGASEVRFVAPVRAGDAVVCRARVTQTKGKKQIVSVEAFVAEKRVLEGVFTTFVLDEHVLEE
jgi:acyl-coenzyme A thioesterase PaaI-like protein